jgi:hypothetical protein
MAICDWDTCLFSEGIYDSCSVPILVNGAYINSVPWPVDGHYIIKAIGENLVQVVESTGGYATRYSVGSTYPLDAIYNPSSYPNIIDNTHRCIEGGIGCGNPTGEYIQAVIFNPPQ